MSADAILISTPLGGIALALVWIGLSIRGVSRRLEYLDDELRRGRHDAIEIKGLREQAGAARAALDRVVRP